MYRLLVLKDFEHKGRAEFHQPDAVRPHWAIDPARARIVVFDGEQDVELDYREWPKLRLNVDDAISPMAQRSVPKKSALPPIGRTRVLMADLAVSNGIVRFPGCTMPAGDPRVEIRFAGTITFDTGQQVQYLHWDDGKMRAARVVAMKDRRVTVLDEASRTHFTLPYAAIVTAPASGSDHGADASVQAKPTPPPEIASRADLRVGNRVSFTDRNLERRVGLIVRINQRTATLDCDGQTWRVGFGLLRPLVDI